MNVAGRGGGVKAELHRLVDAFLARHTTLALATVDDAAGAWVAPLFFAHDERLRCYFLSGSTCRHVRDLRHNRCAVVTVYADGQEWRDIQGLQMKVDAGLVTNRERNHAVSVYAAKFPFVADWLLRKGTAPVELAGPLAGSELWQLRPTWVRLIDNSRGFGHKDEADVTNDGDG